MNLPKSTFDRLIKLKKLTRAPEELRDSANVISRESESSRRRREQNSEDLNESQLNCDWRCTGEGAPASAYDRTSEALETPMRSNSLNASAERSDGRESNGAAFLNACPSTGWDELKLLVSTRSLRTIGGRGRRIAAAEENFGVTPCFAASGWLRRGRVFFNSLVCTNRFCACLKVSRCVAESALLQVKNSEVRSEEGRAGSARLGIALICGSSSGAWDGESTFARGARANKSNWKCESGSESRKESCVVGEDGGGKAESILARQFVTAPSGKFPGGSAKEIDFASATDWANCEALDSSSTSEGGANSEDRERQSPDCARRRSRTKRASRDSTSACTQSFRTSRASLRKFAARLRRVSSKLSSVSFDARIKYSSGNSRVRI